MHFLKVSRDSDVEIGLEITGQMVKTLNNIILFHSDVRQKQLTFFPPTSASLKWAQLRYQPWILR